MKSGLDVSVLTEVSSSNDATEVDFLCVQNGGGVTCAGILSDSSVLLQQCVRIRIIIQLSFAAN